MAHALTDDWYGPSYVETHQVTQPAQTMVSVTTNQTFHQPPPRPVPPRQAPPRPAPPCKTVQPYVAMVSDHVILSAPPILIQAILHIV